MSAFTSEQIAILMEAFTHVHARIAAINQHLDDDSTTARVLSVAVQALGVPAKRLEAMRQEIAAGKEVDVAIYEGEHLTEPDITERILGGDLTAFHRRFDEERRIIERAVQESQQPELPEGERD